MRLFLTDNPPSPGKVGHAPMVYIPYSFRTVVSHKNKITESTMRQNLRFFHYSRGKDSLAICI